MFPPAIETDRLRLQRFCRENVDLRSYYRICADDPGIEAVTEHVPWDPHDTPKETLELLERKERQWEEREKAPYVIRPREGEDGAGEVAGQCGLRPAWDRQVATLNVWLRRRFWGRGYSGERAAAMLELAFERLDLEMASVNVVVDNDNSRRAVERYVDRFGGRREGVIRNNIVVDGEPHDQVRYTVSRAEWADNRPDDLEVRFRD